MADKTLNYYDQDTLIWKSPYALQADVTQVQSNLTNFINEATETPTRNLLPLPSGFSDGEISYRKGINNLVELRIELTKETDFAPERTVIGMLPNGYKPEKSLIAFVNGYTANGVAVSGAILGVSLGTNGEISISEINSVPNARLIFGFVINFYSVVV